MAHVGDEVAAGFLSHFNARDVVKHGQCATRRQWCRIDLKDAPRSKGTGAAKSHFASLERTVHAGQQFRIAHRVDERTADANLVAGDALHDRVGPAHLSLGGDGNDRLLHGIEHGGKLVATALDFCKVLAETFGGLVERGFHGGELVAPLEVKARTQVALGDAPGKRHNALQSLQRHRPLPTRPAAGRPPAQSAQTTAPRGPGRCRVSGARCSMKRRRINSITTVCKTSRRANNPSSFSNTLRVNSGPAPVRPIRGNIVWSGSHHKIQPGREYLAKTEASEFARIQQHGSIRARYETS